jgi:hypothetical protein
MHPLARTEGLAVRALPDETLVYDRLRHKAHCLNPAAAAVWRLCDGRTDPAAMARLLHERTGLPADEALVRLALDQLARRHLLAGDGEAPAAPAGAERLSRREALKKLAAAAVALPVVMTVASRGARVHASGPPTPTPPGKPVTNDFMQNFSTDLLNCTVTITVINTKTNQLVSTRTSQAADGTTCFTKQGPGSCKNGQCVGKTGCKTINDCTGAFATSCNNQGKSFDCVNGQCQCV